MATQMSRFLLESDAVARTYDAAVVRSSDGTAAVAFDASKLQSLADILHQEKDLHRRAFEQRDDDRCARPQWI